MPVVPLLSAKRWCGMLLFSLLSAAAPQASAAVYYVNANASGANDGSSWTDAYTDLSAALSAASITGAGDEIWVAAGTYKPASTPIERKGFVLAGDALYGGFAGGETLLTQRDPAAHPTILSGDIGIAGDNSDNSYHVLVVESGTSIVDGFTVTGGNASGSRTNAFGGGIWIVDGVMMLKNLILIDNHAISQGGGIHVMHPQSVFLINVIFSRNSAAKGGAIYHGFAGSSSFVNVVFSGNSATVLGGGIMIWPIPYFIVVNPSINNSIFWGNTAPDGAQISLGDVYSTVSLADSIVEGACPSSAVGTVSCNNVLDLDPLFVNAAADDLHLQAGSPAIDAGDNAALPAEVTTDLDWQPRIYNGVVDLGPYEKQPEKKPEPIRASIAGKPIGLGMMLALLGLAAYRSSRSVRGR